MPIEIFFPKSRGHGPLGQSQRVAPSLFIRDIQSPIYVTFISFKYHDIRKSSDSPIIIILLTAFCVCDSNLPSFSTIHLSQREKKK